jgi:hypothetical protein
MAAAALRSAASSSAAVHLGHDDGGDLAYMPRLVDRDRQLWRRQRPKSVAVFQAQISRVPAVQERDRVEAVGEKVAPGQHRQCAQRPLRRGNSIECIRACACGERTITAWAWFGKFRSSL